MARICMIAYSEYLSDARIRREAESLAQRGDQVDLICLPHEQRARPSSLNGVHLYPLKVSRYRGHSTWRYTWSYAAFFCRALLLVTWRHLRIRYDLVQVHTMPDFMVFTALLPRFTGAGVLLDVHDLMPELYMSKFGLGSDSALIKALLHMERISVAFAHRAIAVHRTHLEALINHGSRPERFEVLMNVPDPFVFRRIQSNSRNGLFKLTYHGTISRRHGLELALRAVALAKQHILNLRFSIIGNGDDLGRLVRLADELDLQESVEFTKGSVPVDELPGLLADADLGIVPLKRDSFTEYMLPVKLMEYAALGIPVIVTHTRTIAQYFDDTMVEYISGDSSEELANRIVKLYHNPYHRSDMACRAAEFTRRYNWDTQKRVYHRLVDSMIAGQRRKQCRRNTESGDEANERGRNAL